MKPRGVLLAFLGAALVGIFISFGLGGLMLGDATPSASTVSALVFAVLAAFAGAALAQSYPHSRLGFCNTVTLLRLSLASVLVGACVAGGWSAWPAFAVASTAFALDGLDGFLARREELSSEFGAQFDMEVDSILALTLAALAFQSGAAGAYVLLLGLPRYLFGSAQLVFPWLKGDLPARFSRKVVCVIQIAALLLMVLPLVGSPLTDWIAGFAAFALIWSFWRDIVWLKQATRA
ncbi:CDP-alcohol phosphatidyltransferase family protein [Gymnodinialimonas hymeniacidonis]|uniref:CDP-alcohol phosphatidyltransferase family protein n=1 Tax=Gymnodinialimonas hymeniacidonis TaxID=3126508 RepID=UPI0034C5DC1B